MGKYEVATKIDFFDFTFLELLSFVDKRGCLHVYGLLQAKVALFKGYCIIDQQMI
jgi:hypothetical protein